MFPRLWWGWLGKDKKNINEYTYRKRQQNRLKQKRNKGFKNLIRKLKKWIFKN
jgi:predicted transcriptional regulator